MAKEIEFPLADAEVIVHALDIIDKVIEKASTALLALGLPVASVTTVRDQSMVLRSAAKKAQAAKDGGRDPVWPLSAYLMPTLRCALTLYTEKLVDILNVQTKLGIDEPTDTQEQLDAVKRIHGRASDQVTMELSITRGK